MLLILLILLTLLSTILALLLTIVTLLLILLGKDISLQLTLTIHHYLIIGRIRIKDKTNQVLDLPLYHTYVFDLHHYLTVTTPSGPS